MEMKRRGFILAALNLGAAFVPAIGKVIAKTLPARFTQASRVGAFSIPVKKLRDADIRKPAKWRG
jgi:hypothetical protein